MRGKAQDDDVVMSLVDSALARPREERESFLRDACGEDPDLFRKAWSYVEWDDRMHGFLEEPLFQPLSVEHPFERGDVLEGRFRIDREIAQGGMGVVYEAWDEKLERRIAIKCAKTGFRQRLPPEVRHAREIAHPNVCKIFEIHTAQTSSGEIDFVTMEYLEGETLGERLKRSPLKEREARSVAAQLCAGLAAAHAQGVIHGDLKSNNVILTKSTDGATRAVITDFGMASALESAEGSAQSGPRGGTPDYMAPELWKGEKATPASDVYALGVLLHELSTGHKPGKSEAGAGRREASTSPFSSIVTKCLAEDPAARYPSAAEVELAFEPSRTRRWFLIAAAAVLIAALTGFVTYQRATAPKEVVRLAMLPFDYPADLAPAAQGVFREAAANLAKLTGGTRARYSAVSLDEVERAEAATPQQARAKFGATHVLHGTLTKEKGHLLLHAFLTDTRTGANAKDWKMEYAPGQMRYLPVALAGIVTGTLHLPPLAVAAMNALAQADYNAGSTLLRRDATYDAAVSAFERAVTNDPDSALAYAGLAEAQWAKYSINKETEWLSRATQNEVQAQRRNPDLARAWLVTGTLDLVGGFYDRAVAGLQRAIELDANYSDAYRLLGRTLEVNGQFDQALAALHRGIALDPGYYRNYLYLGNYYIHRNQDADAIEPLQHAAALAPEEPDARYPLAFAYMNLGRFSEAESEMRAVLRFRETGAALNLLGQNLMYLKREAEAIPILTRSAALNPNDYSTFAWLGISYRRLGRVDESVGAYRSGVKAAEREVLRSPRTARSRGYLAYFRACLGERAQAESDIAQAFTFSVDGSEVRWAAVMTYEALRERDNTISVLGSASAQFLADLNRWPDFAGMQNDSRFVQMLLTNHVQ